MEFKKYQHVEKLGTTEVDGIEIGTCYVFPKIDGTNASVWLRNEEVHAGSRRRHLSLDSDNAGFCQWVLNGEKAMNIKDCLIENPNLRLFGEWLVPHSLKTYRQEAWRKFYIFDVCVEDESLERGYRHMPYDEYRQILDKWELDYIPPLAIIKNPDYDKLIAQLERNDFLIENGKGFGEGVVVKNYEFVNKFGRQTWAKIVTSEFKEKHSRTMGAPEMKGKDMIEESIVDKYCTQALIDKVYANICNECNGWSSKYIARLLHTVYYDLVREHTWDFVKEKKNPKIDFKLIMRFTTIKVKKLKNEIF